jgi:hypothetical protein
VKLLSDAIGGAEGLLDVMWMGEMGDFPVGILDPESTVRAQSLLHGCRFARS